MSSDLAIQQMHLKMKVESVAAVSCIPYALENFHIIFVKYVNLCHIPLENQYVSMCLSISDLSSERTVLCRCGYSDIYALYVVSAITGSHMKIL